MNKIKPLTDLWARMTLLIVASAGMLNAEGNRWHEEAEPRIRAIYERNELQGKNIDATWLPDSSGYITQEKDRKTNKLVRIKHDIQSGKQSEVDESVRPARSTRVSPDGEQIIEYRGRQLVVRHLENDQETLLTKHSADRDLYYRNPVWSPDGKWIAFVESDETDVRLRSMLRPTDPSYPEISKQRFARVGEKIAKLRIGIVASDGKKRTWLPIECPQEGYYVGQVDLAGSSEELLVEKYSRFRDQRKFLLFNIDSGNVRTIYEESDEAWVVSSQGKNSGLTWIRNGEAFIVVSEKDGWRHAYIHDRSGKQLSLLTPGNYDIIDRAAVDEKRGWFYFYASPDNGTQRYLYRVPLDGSGKLQRITPDDQPGTHEYNISPHASWAVHTYSTFDTPPVVDLIELPEHRVHRVLEDNQELQEQAQRLIPQPTEFMQLDIGDGVSLDAWVIKPRDFDKSQKYPVLVYVYGEPHLQTVLDKWGAGQSHFLRVVADLGYIVVSIDNRGTPAPKGAAWRRSIFGRLGPLSTEDQAAALKELARRRAYIDLSRVAIWGWSGGGSNTLNAMFRKPDLYDVGIAVVPKPQPHLYNAWFQEIYMRTREVNPDGYEQSAPINFAEGLKGKLLIITGSGETNTHIQIIEGLVDRLIALGKPFDYMVYPNRNHGLREGKGTKVHVRMLIIRYLVENLPCGPG